MLSNVFTAAPAGLFVDQATANAVAGDLYLQRNNGSLAAGPFLNNGVRAYNVVPDLYGAPMPVTPLEAAVGMGITPQFGFSAFPRLSAIGSPLPPYVAAQYAFGMAYAPYRCAGGCPGSWTGGWGGGCPGGCFNGTGRLY
jgi:hypothetical protein